MGLLDMLKRGKDSKEEPAPGFPEMPAERLPPLPESSLPPLPQEIEGTAPSGIPPIPEMGQKADLPVLPKQDSGLPEMPADTGLPELPPEKPVPVVPKIETTDIPIPDVPGIPEAPAAIPEVPKTETKDIPIPPALPEKNIPTVKHEIPEPKMEHKLEAPKPVEKPTSALEFPKVPEAVPNTIPPLEGIDAPEFKAPAKAMVTEEHIMPGRDHKGPLFVKVSSFKTIMETITESIVKFKEEDNVFFRITDVKNNQDKKFEKFRKTLEDMQRKFLFVDKTLFER
ncbi:hypothetical protein ACFL0V_03295 [Nanoarchaeota archaeon]